MKKLITTLLLVVSIGFIGCKDGNKPSRDKELSGLWNGYMDAGIFYAHKSRTKKFGSKESDSLYEIAQCFWDKADSIDQLRHPFPTCNCIDTTKK